MGFKTQIGLSDTANFEDSTWTFEMDKDFSVTAGKFAIIPIEPYEKALNNIQIAIEAIGNNAQFAFLKDDLRTIFKLLNT